VAYQPRRPLPGLPSRTSAQQAARLDAGLDNILRDYFEVDGQDPVYNEDDLETRFRVPRAVFWRVESEDTDTPFFRRRINATGLPQAHPLQKVAASFRVLAYGEAADRADEYARLSRSTILYSVKSLVACIVSRCDSTHLLRHINAELKTVLDRNAERGFPGSMGSLDWRNWKWHQCPRWYSVLVFSLIALLGPFSSLFVRRYSAFSLKETADSARYEENVTHTDWNGRLATHILL